MKEVTYDDWQKNPIPRMMWVWDDFKEEAKEKKKVVYIINGGRASVLTVIDENRYRNYQHCAEVEKSKRMTNKELARWWKSLQKNGNISEVTQFILYMTTKKAKYLKEIKCLKKFIKML